jgi:hypothetical protein
MRMMMLVLHDDAQLEYAYISSPRYYVRHVGSRFSRI